MATRTPTTKLIATSSLGHPASAFAPTLMALVLKIRCGDENYRIRVGSSDLVSAREAALVALGNAAFGNALHLDIGEGWESPEITEDTWEAALSLARAGGTNPTVVRLKLEANAAPSPPQAADTQMTQPASAETPQGGQVGDAQDSTGFSDPQPSAPPASTIDPQSVPPVPSPEPAPANTPEGARPASPPRGGPYSQSGSRPRGSAWSSSWSGRNGAWYAMGTAMGHPQASQWQSSWWQARSPEATAQAAGPAQNNPFVEAAAHGFDEGGLRTQYSVMYSAPMVLRNERLRIVRGMLSGSLRLVDAELILEDTMVSGEVRLEGRSRLVLLRGMMSGCLRRSPESSFENRGFVTGWQGTL